MDGRALPHEFRRHWAALAGATIGMVCGLSALGVSFTLNLFVRPLEVAFGWSHTQILMVPLILAVGVVPSALLVGWLADRVGVRKLILFSQGALGLCFVALGVLTRRLQVFYILYAAMALLAAGTLPITFSKLLTERFGRHRGLALGIAQSGTGLCGVFAPAYISWFITHWGWRAGYVAIGALPLLVALPMSVWLIPKDKPLHDAKATLEVSAPERPETFRRTLCGYRFWAMGTAFFLVSAAVTGILANFSPLLALRHYPRDAAAALQGLFGAVLILGRVSVGVLVDRLWAPLVGACFLIPAGLSAWMLRFAATGKLDALPIFVIALTTGAEVDLCAYLSSRYFGLGDYGKVYGAQFLMLAMGGGLAAPLYGRLYDVSHNYNFTLLLMGVGFLGSALLLLSLGRYPQASGVSDRR